MQTKKHWLKPQFNTPLCFFIKRYTGEMLMVLATDLRQEELQVPSIYDLYGYV